MGSFSTKMCFLGKAAIGDLPNTHGWVVDKLVKTKLQCMHPTAYKSQNVLNQCNPMAHEGSFGFKLSERPMSHLKMAKWGPLPLSAFIGPGGEKTTRNKCMGYG